ncbi:alpha/beta fold hydrolase [Streptomyces sp. NPDC087856]|uniref:alpha/beta fold hydrolase n=1 Tax=Streptomyces sp. NPDC087856 TaxID=3365811 RepID=UPI0037F7C087
MRTVRVVSAEFDVRDEGEGDPVLLVAGGGASGRVWDLHQVPALRAAGFRVLTFDRRSLQEPSAPSDPRTVADELAYVLAELDIPELRAVGVSSGGEVVQELMLARPRLVTGAVLMATRGRGDLSGRAMADAERELAASGVSLPPGYAAWQRAVLNLSPATWRREDELLDWLDLFETAERAGSAPVPVPAGGEPADRLDALGRVAVPVLVLGFEHDLIVPPWLCREVAAALPLGRYVEVADCGHYGYLERPAEVNSALLEFLTGAL